MMTNEHGDGRLPPDVPASYVVELAPDHFVVCEIKLVLHDEEQVFAREVFNNFLRSHGDRALRAAPLPAHLIVTRYTGQAAR